MRSIKFSEKLLKTNPYYLGLDVGTNSIGWAITDQNYNIIKKNGKALWGTYLFKEAMPASTRRIFRSARRRRKKLIKRIKLLQEYFSDAISEVDPSFFQRIKESFLYAEDKSIFQKNSLFNDASYSDQDYHNQYPTIYHLRNELCISKEKHDPRLVYLAIHHIMKNRGHFLLQGKNFTSNQQTIISLTNFCDLFFTMFEFEIFSSDNLQTVASILSQTGINASDKQKEIQKHLNLSTKQSKEFCKLLVGNSANIINLFELEHNESELKSIKFNDANFETENSQQDIELVLGDDKIIIDSAYTLYNSSLLEQILTSKEGQVFSTISEARINIYETHKFDLKYLKETIKKIASIAKDSKLYYEVFRANRKKLNNYVSYSGKTNSIDNLSPHQRCNYEEFAKYLKALLIKYKKILKKLAEDNDAYDLINGLLSNINSILEGISTETFLPKIVSSANGVIPYQLHEQELRLILENASNYLPFLTNIVRKEIIQIFSFKVPYYVGPFDDRKEKSEFGWLVRNSNEPIRPWNLNKVVDIPATSEQFIKRMTNKCSHLIGEDVLPKESLLYSEFLALQGLNMLTIDGYRLDHEIKQKLYDHFFVERSQSGKITKKRIVNALRFQGIFVKLESIGGIDQEIPVKLKALKDFKRILPNQELLRKDIEKIIAKITIFPDSVELIKSWLEKEFSEKLSLQQISDISKLKYSGWGNLSRRLLTKLKHKTPDGRKRSIIEIMREESVLLQELISRKYTFSEQINKNNESYIDDPNVITEDYLSELYLSPAVKKAVRKTLLIGKELFKIMGGSPQKVFIEMSRGGDNPKKATKSRKKQLGDLYKSLKDDVTLWNDVLSKKPEEQFKSKILYLYSIQKGKCMYSGESIDLEDPNFNSKYDIDHIRPRSLTKDDSFDNLVLVKQELNRSKANNYLIDDHIQKKQGAFWKMLYQQGFISEDKYKRLIRKNDFSPDELQGFLNRQLVETRQSTKVIADIYNRLLHDSDVVYVKANLVSDFRYSDGRNKENKTQFYFPKVRFINDFHHAKDAYLNIVVGNCYHSKFTQNFYMQLSKIISSNPKSYDFNFSKFYDKEIKYKNQDIWIPGRDGTIKTITKYMGQNNVLVNYESYRQSGGLYDQMLVKKGLGQHPIKTSIPQLAAIDKYGGFNKLTGSHFSIVKYKKRNKEEIGIVNIPLILKKYNFSNKSIIEYLISEGYEDPTILVSELKYHSLIVFNGQKYRIKAKTGSQLKCSPFIQASYSLNLEKFIKELERINKNENFETITKENLDALFTELVGRLTKAPFSNFRAFKNQGEMLENNLNIFIELTIKEKIDVIFSIILLLTGFGEPVNLSPVKLSRQAGVNLLTVNNKNHNKLTIINRSITGFFENSKEIF